MFGFIKKLFVITTSVFSCIASNVIPLKCVSINNQKCRIRPEIIYNEPIFYPYSIEINKCNGSCNNINNPYAKLCVPDVVKNMNLKVFNLMSRTNKTTHIKWHEMCKCDKGFWNPSICECARDKTCDVREYLDYKNCKCTKKLIDKLVEECSENIDGIKMIYSSND